MLYRVSSLQAILITSVPAPLATILCAVISLQAVTRSRRIPGPQCSSKTHVRLHRNKSLRSRQIKSPASNNSTKTIRRQCICRKESRRWAEESPWKIGGKKQAATARHVSIGWSREAGKARFGHTTMSL